MNAQEGYPATDGNVQATIDAELNVADKTYTLPLPIVLKPDNFDPRQDWDTQYQNCLRILMYYAPTEVRDARLPELQGKHKGRVSVEDLIAFRKITWEISCRAYREQASNEMSTAWWYEKFEQGATVLEAFSDIAFNLVVAQITGPIGSFALQQIKGWTKDFLVKYQETDKPFVDFLEDFVTGKLPDFAASTLDAVVFSDLDKLDRTALMKWLAIMYVYKFAYHWYFDTDDAGKPKGFGMAFVNATKDVSSTALETMLKKYADKSFENCKRKDVYDKFKLKAKEENLVAKGTQLASDAQKAAMDKGKQMAQTAREGLDKAADAAQKAAEATKQAAGKLKDATVDAALKAKDMAFDMAEKTGEALSAAADDASQVAIFLARLIREKVMGQS